ncbi:MAG TPA: GNAT family N-acetyltransferase [Anaerovoracaceae bacterium]|nr:GNAT family N-acetyltransferase [Anaerovoracaceae bacterium]
MEQRINFTTPEEYLSLRRRSQRENKDFKRSEVALNNSLFMIGIYDNGFLVAFGRVIGDGGITYIVSDVMVDTNYWRQGLGDKIMCAIDGFLNENTYEDSYICLIAKCPADKLYLKHNFEYLEGKHGMVRKQK